MAINQVDVVCEDAKEPSTRGLNVGDMTPTLNERVGGGTFQATADANAAKTIQPYAFFFGRVVVEGGESNIHIIIE